MDEEHWRNRAACLNHSLANGEFDPWFPPEGTYNAPRESVLICRSCPVRRECLADALAVPDDGVRAGLTTNQRKAIQRPRRRKRCPVCGGRDLIPVEDNLQVCAACAHAWLMSRIRGPLTKTAATHIAKSAL